MDAALLEDVAKLGRGNIMFTDDPQELPRLFTEDTMSVARSTFVEKDPATQPDGIGGQLIPNARLMGDLPDLSDGGFPNVDGYNLSYLKPDATQRCSRQDEYAAPWSAFWYRAWAVRRRDHSRGGRAILGRVRTMGTVRRFSHHSCPVADVDGVPAGRVRRPDPRRTGRGADGRTRSTATRQGGRIVRRSSSSHRVPNGRRRSSRT